MCVQYIGVQFGDIQLVLHRSVLPNGVVYVTVCELVPSLSSAQIPL